MTPLSAHQEEDCYRQELLHICALVGREGFHWFVPLPTVKGWLVLQPFYSDEGHREMEEQI